MDPEQTVESHSGIQITVVVPVYNCAKWVLQKLDRIIDYFSVQPRSWELIVVDDGSEDGTAEVVRRYLKGMNGASLLAFPRNIGKGKAVLAGLRAGRGRYRLFMDCDLTYPLTEATKLIEALDQGADVAIANRRSPQSVCELSPVLFKQVYSRYWYGKVFNRMIRVLGLTRSKDTQAGLKSMRAEAIKVLDGMRAARFAFDIELLHLIELGKYKITEVPVRYEYFDEGSSIKVFSDGWKMIVELLQIKFNSMRGKYTNDIR